MIGPALKITRTPLERLISTPDNSSKLWFERLYARFGLPFWAGVLLVGFLPPLMLTLLGYYAYRVETDFTGDISLGVPLLLANIVYILFSSRYARVASKTLSDTPYRWEQTSHRSKPTI